eukprot:UN27192
MGSAFGKIDDYESPKYTTISKTDQYEIRSYLANIAIDGPTQGSNGFRNLAKYIGVGSDPYNERKEAISMTAPVVTYNTENNTNTRMQFILPSELENPPNPLDKNLDIVHRDSAIYGVMTFGGNINHEQSVEKKNEFVNLLKKDKVPIMEPVTWELWRFNPPWTIPSLRTNEIAVKVDKKAFNEANNEKNNKL